MQTEVTGAPASVASLASARLRLGDLDGHFHCSVLGTCFPTRELRKLMARYVDVDAMSDLEVHHEAVKQTSHAPDVAKALHKALDRRYDAALQRFAIAADTAALEALWDEALRSGEVPAAYWAILTHRKTTASLRQRVFGDVHMLSHLLGAANRADIRRLAALEQENEQLVERMERSGERMLQLVSERDLASRERDESVARVVSLERAALTREHTVEGSTESNLLIANLRDELAVQKQRAESSDALIHALRTDLDRQRREIEDTLRHAEALAEELAVAETWLQRDSANDAGEGDAVVNLQGERILYVGGRPSSTSAIRQTVLRYGGEFTKHDGGLEQRKGMLSAALSWATLVVFPVDCVDHDSALQLKRDCVRHSKRFFALRSASVSSFLTAVGSLQPGDAAVSMALRQSGTQ